MYIFKVLKQVHLDIVISSKFVEFMNNFIIEMFGKLAQEYVKIVLAVIATLVLDAPRVRNRTQQLGDSLLGINTLVRLVRLWSLLGMKNGLRWCLMKTWHCRRRICSFSFALEDDSIISVVSADCSDRRPLLLYMSVSDLAFGCVVTGRKEQAIYYLSKKFTLYEAKYNLLERTCCALTWAAQRLTHYFPSFTAYLISRMDPLKYIFQKPVPTGRLA